METEKIEPEFKCMLKNKIDGEINVLEKEIQGIYKASEHHLKRLVDLVDQRKELQLVCKKHKQKTAKLEETRIFFENAKAVYKTNGNHYAYALIEKAQQSELDDYIKLCARNEECKLEIQQIVPKIEENVSYLNDFLKKVGWCTSRIESIETLSNDFGFEIQSMDESKEILRRMKRTINNQLDKIHQ